MRLWPFGRKREEEEESAFGSSPGARVAPAAPPVIGSEAVAEPAATPPAAPPAAPRTAPQSGAIPSDILHRLAQAGIHIDPKAQIQVSTQTTELTGQEAWQFLGQIGSFLGSTAANVQLHPSVNIVAGGRLQESPQQLKASGADAQVTVKDLEDRLAMGDTHVVKLKLEVQRPGGQPYEVTTGAIVPARITEHFAEGKTFPAKVDPNDPNQVLVLWPE